MLSEAEMIGTLKCYEHSLENWLISQLRQGKYQKSIEYLMVLNNKEGLKIKDANMKMA